MNVSRPPGASRTRITDALWRGSTTFILPSGVHASDAVRSAAGCIDQQLHDGPDDRQAQGPADERPAEMNVLQGARQGGEAVLFSCVSRRLKREAIEVAQ